MGGKNQPSQPVYPNQPQSTQTSGASAAIDPYLRNLYGLAKEQFTTRSPEVAGYGDEFQTAKERLGETSGGKYLYGGEGFNAALEAAKNKIIPDVESRFARGGRLQSGLARTAEASGIGDAFANLYSGERRLQEEATGKLPQLSEAERLVQQNKYDIPYERLKRYADLISGLPGGTESRGESYGSPQYPGSKGASTLGGALGGASLGSSFGPLAALIGALGGGAAGRFL